MKYHGNSEKKTLCPQCLASKTGTALGEAVLAWTDGCMWTHPGHGSRCTSSGHPTPD